MLLSQRLKACHLSTGDVFRTAASRPECDLTPAMKTALVYMRHGELAPDTTVWEMVRERVGCLRCGGGFILDGFPRTKAQAELLQQFMAEANLPFHAVLNYQLPLDVIVARLSGRRTCRECKAVYHVTRQPPKAKGVCDRCGGSLFQREDDRSESVAIRMEAYRRSTAPLIHFYADLGLLLTVEATGAPEEICDRSVKALEARVPHLPHVPA